MVEKGAVAVAGSKAEVVISEMCQHELPAREATFVSGASSQ